jgi:hypothetical protein
MTTLKDLLADWTDFDYAEHAVAACLGLMPPEWVHTTKWVFWTDKPIGNMLHKVLESLVEQNVLEKNEDDQYRYNHTFSPPWDAESLPAARTP